MNTNPTHATASRWSYEDDATADAAGALRRRLSSWLESRALKAISVDVVLAAYEAMANSVEHAFVGRSGPGRMSLTAVHDGPVLVVTIADTGTWLEHGPTPNRGRGLRLAEAISDSVDVHHDGGTGTLVTLTWNLPADHYASGT
ncbi:anti-sigma regulatory factor [Rhodococcoides trifolii]|uniref:Anti-sigma regulatory factor n=1 Tax=Rhodococcoides trifolii TaxID=908250 RepID=A0A917LFY8_9NOCA|nr:ATP-binding protein [Rhodococcus trifolii]GGG19716.1 anti-sigma regulatory factor [Rhodococcus trifolii]